jgi:hypothetical protein
MRTLLSFVMAAFLAAAQNDNTRNAGTPEDQAAVHRAALDYVEAIYEGKPELIDKSVSPELSKRGVYYNAKERKWIEAKMPFERLKAISLTFNKGKKDSSQWPKRITVFEVMNQTANVKVVADWGMDYLQLVKQEGQWKIVNIVWQSLPSASEKPTGSGH